MIAAVSVALTGCATTPKSFYANPAKATDTSLCRAVGETKDAKFQQDAAAELVRRGMTAEKCQQKITNENTGLAVIGIFAGAVAIGAAGGYGGGGYYQAPRAYGVAWDQFYGPSGYLIWRCRDKYSGQFVDDYRCSGMSQIDTTWPGYRA